VKTLTKTLIVVCTLLVYAIHSHAYVDDAHSFAMNAASSAVKKGYAVRQEYWSGATTIGQSNGLTQQLFKGNDYWFWLGSDEDTAQVTIHVYDASGKLVDSEAWQKGQTAAVRVTPKKTGIHYIIFSIERARTRKMRWAVAYGYKAL